MARRSRGRADFVKRAGNRRNTDVSHLNTDMAKPVPLPPPGFDDLSVDEKIDYLESLWNQYAYEL